jgi:hypothetical protein
MRTIAILPEQGENHLMTFSAVTTGRKATGRTVGEALDALTSQLSAEETYTPVIVQQFRPDRHFSAEQRDRLATLMARQQAALETGEALSAVEQSELERLVDEEIQGAGKRAAQMLRNLKTAQLRRSYQGIWPRLKAWYETERWLDLQLHRGVLGTNIFDLFLFIGVGLVLYRGSSTVSIGRLIIGVLLFIALKNGFDIFLLWRAARKQAKSLESSSDPGKDREQTKAR